MSESELQRQHEYFEKSSMNYWYPKVKDLDVNQPKTEKIELEQNDDEEDWIRYKTPVEKVQRIEQELGAPMFARTDQASNKHRMASASKIDSTEEDEIHSTLRKLFQFNQTAGMLGLPYSDLYIREWLDLEHNFKAFDNTPIAQELRFFVNNGNILYYHFYWPKNAIKFRTRYMEDGEPDNWEDQWVELRNDALASAQVVKPDVRKVAQEFDGFWSIDFAKGSDGNWYLIDMAKGEVSWHPKTERGKAIETVEDYKDSYERELVYRQ